MSLQRKGLGMQVSCLIRCIGQIVTYHHRWVVPLLVGACGIRVDAVVDDLERRQADGLHGAEVGLPEPTGLRTNR